MTLTLEHVKNDEVKEGKDGVITLAGWRCDLNKKIFVLSMSGKKIFYEVSGVFELDDKAGVWQAGMLTEKRN